MRRSISAIRKHQNVHSDIAECKKGTDCGKGFSFDSELKTYLTIPMHHCVICKKSYKNKDELTTHITLHGKNIYRCGLCKNITQKNRET